VARKIKKFKIEPPPNPLRERGNRKEEKKTSRKKSPSLRGTKGEEKRN
jgi:hypothetical protein